MCHTTREVLSTVNGSETAMCNKRLKQASIASTDMNS